MRKWCLALRYGTESYETVSKRSIASTSRNRKELFLRSRNLGWRVRGVRELPHSRLNIGTNSSTYGLLMCRFPSMSENGRETLRGSIVNHKTKRVLIPTDNSPAHWSFMSAFKGGRLTIAEVKAEITADEF